ncbi:hypothetical protein ES703_106259 [subsurface metagenome]
MNGSKLFEIMIPGRAYAPRSREASRYKATIKDIASKNKVRKLKSSLSIRIIYCYSNTQFRLDGDNLLKIVCDALKGIAYEDDSQIDSHHIDRLNTSSGKSVEINDPPPSFFDYIGQHGDFILIQLGANL